MQMLLDQHKQEMEFLERNMDNEKSRQNMALAEKIEERKRRRAAAAAEKHKVQMSKELIQQQDERQAVETKMVKSFMLNFSTRRFRETKVTKSFC